MAHCASHLVHLWDLVIAGLVGDVAHIGPFLFGCHVDKVPILDWPHSCISHVIDSGLLALNLDGVQDFDLFELRVDALQVFLNGQLLEEDSHRKAHYYLTPRCHFPILVHLHHHAWFSVKLLPIRIVFDFLEFLHGLFSQLEK